jgi:hypothetical protein
MTMLLLDQYRMQEAAFGHVGFLGGEFWRNAGVAWLEQHLMVPLTSRTATHRVRDIRYNIDGKWVDTTEAVKRGAMSGIAPMQNFARVRIVYDNGLTVIANSATNDFVVGDTTLPEFGWIATNEDFAAGTIRRDGVVVDFVSAPDYQFANARRARDWNFGGPVPVSVRVTNFQSLENKRFKFSYDWKTGAKLTRDLHCFVHFDKPGTHGNH